MQEGGQEGSAGGMVKEVRAVTFRYRCLACDRVYYFWEYGRKKCPYCGDSQCEAIGGNLLAAAFTEKRD